MTESAPAAMALVRSPENLTPPSAMMGTPCFFASWAQSMMAVIWGTPTPATTRVVQMEPGPIPTLMPSAPALIRSAVASFVATLPAITCDVGVELLDGPYRLNDPLAVAMGGIHHKHVHPGPHQGYAPLQPVRA